MEIKRFVPCMTTKASSINEEKRTLTATITSDSVDRDGEIIDPKAFEKRIGSFLKNPVLLWNHNPMETPIGKVASLDFKGDSVQAEMQFRAAGDSQRADDVFSLYRQNILTSFSVGFRVFATEEEDNKPLRITDAELFEVSAVTIPANTDAVVKLMKQAQLLEPALSTKHVSTAKTIYGKPSDLDVLRRAKELIEELLDVRACGNEIERDKQRAMDDLRLALLVGQTRATKDQPPLKLSELLTALDVGVANLSADGGASPKEGK